jgi:aspartyl-tRNA synthetase
LQTVADEHRGQMSISRLAESLTQKQAEEFAQLAEKEQAGEHFGLKHRKLDLARNAQHSQFLTRCRYSQIVTQRVPLTAVLLFSPTCFQKVRIAVATASPS